MKNLVKIFSILLFGIGCYACGNNTERYNNGQRNSEQYRHNEYENQRYNNTDTSQNYQNQRNNVPERDSQMGDSIMTR